MKLTLLMRLLRLAWAERKWMALATLFSFLTLGSSVGLMMTSGYLISLAALHPSIAALQVWVTGVRFFGVARGLSRYMERLLGHEATFRLLSRFRVHFFRRLEPLSPAGLGQERSGDLLSRLASDVDSLEHIFTRWLGPPLSALITGVVVTLVLGIFGFQFALIFAVAYTLGALLPFATLPLSMRWNRQIAELRGALSSRMVEGVQGLTELWVMGRVGDWQQQLAREEREYSRLQRWGSLLMTSQDAVVGFFMYAAALGVLYVGIDAIQSGALLGVHLAVLVLGAMAAFEALQGFPAMAHHLQTSLAAADRLYELTDRPVPVQDPAHPVALPETRAASAKGLRLQGVRFSYPGDTEPVLDGIDMELVGGRVTGLIGLSGAGKSTLVQILCRFLQPQGGRILWGDVDWTALAQDHARTLLGVVDQDPHFFSGSLSENLRMAAPASDAELRDALDTAGLGPWILELPDGLDTDLGEQGVRLSGGQRQRLAAARAILRKAPILLLDEPAGHLDLEGERELVRNLAGLPWQPAVLWITHRREALRDAHRVYLLAEGRMGLVPL